MSGDFTDEVFDPDEQAAEEKLELSQLIDGWLAEKRPDRYDKNDKGWLDSVVDQAAAELAKHDRDEMIRDAAYRRVHAREGQATRKANDFLRDIARTGQLPIGWGEGEAWKALCDGLLRLPLSIGRQRVRLGAATPSDLTEWIMAREVQQDKELAARELSRNGAALLMNWMHDQGVSRIEDVRHPSGS